MNAEQFVARVLPPGDFAIVFWKKPNGPSKTKAFAVGDRGRIGSYLQWASATAGADAYIAPASFVADQIPAGVDAQGRPKFRDPRLQSNVQNLRAFWIDIDVKRVGDKKGTNVYPDRRSALAWVLTFVRATGLPPPNLWVDSGYGYHVYWVLEDPMARSEWQPYTDALAHAAGAHGFKCETGITSDAARILRSPGTMNVKVPTSPAPVRVLDKHSRGDYPNQLVLQALQRFVGLAATARTGTSIVPAAATTVVASGSAGALAGGAPSHILLGQGPQMNAAAQANLPTRRDHEFAKIAPRCKQVELSLASQGNGDPYQLWYLGFLSLAHHCIDGTAYTHEVSKGDPRYTAAETDAAVARIAQEQAIKDTGPPRCASFDGWRPGVCTGCPHFGRILSPWNLGADDTAATGNAVGCGTSLPPGPGAPFTQMPHTMSGADAEVQLNARLCKVADYGGTPAFGRFNLDGSVTHLKPTDLPVLLSGHFVATPDGKGGTKYLPAAVWWVQSSTKLVFDAIRYDPEGNYTRPGEIVLNTWRGFAVQAAKGSWRRMCRHIWLLCGRNHAAFKYLVLWLAHLVQHPGSNPGVMVVLRSDKEGVGKSSLGQWLLRIFGAHGREIADTTQVFGSFNDGLVGVSFILLEEPVFPGDHRAAEMLRAMLTARTLRINPKGRPAYDIPHGIHCMMTTNGAWAIPAGAEARRFLMLDVRGDVLPRSYFDALWAEAEAGGIAAMLHDLLAVDLRQFNPRNVPATAALVEQQRRSADDITAWLTDAILNGALLPGTHGGGFNTTCASNVLHGAYVAWAATQGVRRVKTSREFGRALGELGLARGAGNNPPKWTIPDRATLHAAADRRAGIRRITR